MDWTIVICNFPCWELGGGHTNVGNIFSRFPTVDFPIILKLLDHGRNFNNFESG